MIKLNSRFLGLKDEATKAFERRKKKKKRKEKAKTINCHHSDVL
jgi:hypothetical protein